MQHELIELVLGVVEKQRERLSDAYDTCPLDKVEGVRRARLELQGLKQPLVEAINKYLIDPFEED